MENLSPVAGAISTYGLYGIIAILCLVVAHLYKRVTLLEKEMRDQLVKFQKEQAEREERRRAELTQLINTSNAVTERNTTALNEINAYFRNMALMVPRAQGATIPPDIH